MANSGDRARFYLEQSVPELQELLRKELFTQEEISAIARKRSDYEHVINARGTTVADFIRYVAYEQNLEALRKKRTKRLGVKIAGYNGQRRIFFIFERATRRFQGDLRLWVQYLDYARSVKAHKRVGKILTAALRLHPHKSELWLLASKYSAESQSDLLAARSYLQRGLRFCPKEKALWLDYVRLELKYIAKTTESLHILGAVPSTGSKSAFEANINDIREDGVDTIQEQSDKTALESLSQTPALAGAIPIAIFDAAMKEFEGDFSFAAQIFNVVAEWHWLSSTMKILKHITHFLSRQVPTTEYSVICNFKLPMIGIDHNSPKFPMAFKHGLQLLRASMHQLRKTKTQFVLAERAIIALLPLATSDDVEPEIHTVATGIIKTTIKTVGKGSRIAEMVDELERDGHQAEADHLLKYGLKEFLSEKTLQQKAIDRRQAIITAKNSKLGAINE